MKKGEKMSAEKRKAISERMKGNKLSLGRVITQEAREKIRISNIGKKHNWTDEGRQRFSLAKKGKPAHNKGKPLSEETKKKMIAHPRNTMGKFGKDNPLWKEVKKSILSDTIRALYKYRQWRSDVFTRDNFTCVLCFASKCYVEADHYPKMFSSILKEYNITHVDQALELEQLWDINNGRTLCHGCHNKTKVGRPKITN